MDSDYAVGFLTFRMHRFQATWEDTPRATKRGSGFPGKRMSTIQGKAQGGFGSIFLTVLGAMNLTPASLHMTLRFTVACTRGRGTLPHCPCLYEVPLTEASRCPGRKLHGGRSRLGDAIPDNESRESPRPIPHADGTP